MRVDDHTIELDSVPVFLRAAPASGTPPVYLHDALMSADDWTPALERTGGVAPDLLGFGRTGKGGHLDYSLPGLASFVGSLLDHLEMTRFSLAGHGWGAAVALELAARRPEQVERLALVNPLVVPADQWRGLGRLWRTPVLGELAIGAVTRRVFARHLRRAAGGGDAASRVWTADRLETAWGHFDHGTQRALLRLYRATDPGHLDALAPALGELGRPALVLGASSDVPLLPSAAIRAGAGRGHWPWLENEAILSVLAAFLTDGPA